MNPEFWHARWQHNEIGFHMEMPHPLLLRYLAQLNLTAGSRIFLPLCGKTRDIQYLLQQGFHVLGSELSQLAVEQLFKDLDLSPEIAQLGQVKRYTAKHIDVFVGDFFDLLPEQLGMVDAIYDRAALIALPFEMRGRYADHLKQLSALAKQLLITIEYEQGELSGPPFSVNSEEVKRLYQVYNKIDCLGRHAISGGLKGRVEADEVVWLIDSKNNKKA